MEEKRRTKEDEKSSDECEDGEEDIGDELGERRPDGRKAGSVRWGSDGGAYCRYHHAANTSLGAPQNMLHAAQASASLFLCATLLGMHQSYFGCCHIRSSCICLHTT